jgi:hypothetical protein
MELKQANGPNNLVNYIYLPLLLLQDDSMIEMPFHTQGMLINMHVGAAPTYVCC